MSTTTDVVPGAGWYRDPSNPAVARWWDGAAWGHQTQELPPLEAPTPAPVPDPVPTPPAPVVAAAPAGPTPEQLAAAALAAAPPPVQPMIAVAEPVAPTQAFDPLGVDPLADAPAPPKTGRKLPSVRMPSVSLPGNPLVALLLILLLAGGGWYAWKTLHSSSASSPAATPTPVVTHSAVAAAPAKPVRLPKTAPSELAGIPWLADPVTRSLAAHIAAGQQRGGHRVVASYYGQTEADRFFFLGSTVTAADRKPVSKAVEKARLARLISAVAAGDRVKTTAFVQIKSAGSPPISCLTGTAPGTLTLCSWQSPTARVVVVGNGPVAPTQLLLNRVLASLSR